MKNTENPAPIILVIDDSPNNLSVIARHLEDHNFEVMIARDGEDGVIKAARGFPDLILLDIMMPGMDGFETCIRLKSTPDTNEIPVLFMTALDGIEDKLKGFEAGGVDYIVKPFNEREAIARIKTHLKIRKLQRDLEEKNRRLKQAMNEIKKLEGIIPICSFCKKIRDDKGYWKQLEAYFQEHSEARFSHSLCQECAKEHYPDLDLSGQ
jgi:DNA-binding response OmpR family regulator